MLLGKLKQCLVATFTSVPLQWSEALKDDAKVWAEKLLDSCGQGMYHDPDNYHYGENVAGNSGSGGWGDLRSPDAILTRFVENEAEKPWPKNSHLTQVLWRSTKYVGCAEASKPYGNNGMCHTQVCRYSRSGKLEVMFLQAGVVHFHADSFISCKCHIS